MVVRPEVLVLSNRRDISVDWVVRRLRERSTDVFRLNTETCNQLRWDMDPCSQRWIVSGVRGSYDLGQVRAVYYRRPDRPRVRGLSRSDAALVRSQWGALIRGLESLEGAQWISPPHRIAEAESKIRQLARARQLGFDVPETLVTNSRSAAMAFARDMGGQVAVKGLDAPMLGPTRRPSFVFTTAVHEERLGELGELDPGPVVLQRLIRPKRDIRVTVIGSHVFAASTDSTEVDWRKQDPPVRFAPYDISKELAHRCIDLVASFGLRFGGIDFVVGPDRRPLFLELNPNGEWGWLEHAGIPIAAAIADELLDGWRT